MIPPPFSNSLKTASIEPAIFLVASAVSFVFSSTILTVSSVRAENSSIRFAVSFISEISFWISPIED